MEASAQEAAPEPPAQETDVFSERPELFVGAAFVGGIALAQALRLIGR
jgi:hypothetical protein